MGWQKKVVTEVAKIIVPDVVELGAKIGADIYEQQKSLVKIPDLKDVHIDEAIRILRDELHLIPTAAVASPNIAYADESENEVMYAQPRFGTRVNPGTTIKVYYLTQDIVDKSKQLLGTVIHEHKVPMVIGVNVYEAREDLEGLGLKVTEKLEKPNLSFSSKEDGQVTRIMYPNGQKVGPKLKTGERIWIYYVNDQVISESKALKEKKEQEKKEAFNKLGKLTQDVTKGLTTASTEATKTIAKNLGQQFDKLKPKSKKGDGK